jgi:hypothetical protein
MLQAGAAGRKKRLGQLRLSRRELDPRSPKASLASPENHCEYSMQRLSGARLISLIGRKSDDQAHYSQRQLGPPQT